MINKKYIYAGLGLGAVGLGIWGFKKIQNKARTQSAIKAIKKGTDSSLGINIPEIAKQIGIELGTAFPKYDPRSWTENDDKAKVLVLKVPKPYIPQLIKEYARFNSGRNLQDDLQRMLDDWNEVSYLFK